MTASFSCSMPSIWRLAVVSISLWVALLVYISLVVIRNEAGLLNTEPSEKDSRSLSDSLEQLQRALSDIEALKQHNTELRNLLRGKQSHLELAAQQFSANIPSISDNETLHEDVSSMEFASSRRIALNGVTELWYYVMGELKKMKQLADVSKDKNIVSAIMKIMRDGGDQQRSVLVNIFRLNEVDTHDELRRTAMQNLSEIVQRRLQYLQNPKDCSKARKLVCHLNKGCGYGCQIHHVVYCMIVAYGTQRTLILDGRGWRYSHRGWTSVFQSLSETCTDETGNSTAHWRGISGMEKIQVLQLPIIDSLRPRSKFLPLAFPEDLSTRLINLHGNPPAWWIGQMVRFLTRPQLTLSKELDERLKALDFAYPVVGIHVRRTDKIASEAQFHALEEYMFWVDDFYRRQEIAGNTVTIKRVYIASDDPNIFDEAAKKYPQYRFIGNKRTARTAQLNSRYSDASLHGVISDIHFLSLSNFLVCTFSSQVCRLAYELMQTYHPDASTWFHSLDDIYYFGGQDAHEQTAILPHKALTAQEMSMETGDVITIAGNHWDGWSKGRNTRTGHSGLYPSYKTKERWRIERFPTYPEADSYPFNLPPEQRIWPVGSAYPSWNTWRWDP